MNDNDIEMRKLMSEMTSFIFKMEKLMPKTPPVIKALAAVSLSLGNFCVEMSRLRMGESDE